MSRQIKSSSPRALEVMEARSVETIPVGELWQYEPKWDGFRCLLARSGKSISMTSKSRQDLARYFPEVAAAAILLPERRYVLDGELVVPSGATFSFDSLLQRIHPAASRIKRLSEETPALFIAFDLLRRGTADLAGRALGERRHHLEAFAANGFYGTPFRLSPASLKLSDAKRWLASAGGGSDGIIAKRRDLPYQAGNRVGMQKIKHYRSADCVVGGFRYGERREHGRKVVGSLLLGLYDRGGLLHHVGFTSGLTSQEKPALTDRLEAIIADCSFTGATPGGPSRWSTRRSSEWRPVTPKLVVEVSYDHVSDGRFRHGTTLLRWRPDKKPSQCRMDQLKQEAISPADLFGH
jgi:ATP-dependent DNA ligase